MGRVIIFMRSIHLWSFMLICQRLLLSDALDKNEAWKITKGKIYPPLKFDDDISKTFWVMLHSDEKLSMKHIKGQ
jgi:hypothetical protein